ncbi:MAG: thiazole synthase, partial [Mesorhizobium sp.]
AKAAYPVGMARAFGKAVEAGREAHASGLLEPRDVAVPSTPTIGRAVLS